jgi:hypothetical protein
MCLLSYKGGEGPPPHMSHPGYTGGEPCATTYLPPGSSAQGRQGGGPSAIVVAVDLGSGLQVVWCIVLARI